MEDATDILNRQISLWILLVLIIGGLCVAVWHYRVNKMFLEARLNEAHLRINALLKIEQDRQEARLETRRIMDEWESNARSTEGRKRRHVNALIFKMGVDSYIRKRAEGPDAPLIERTVQKTTYRMVDNT